MRNTKPASAVVPAVDVARFELFLNVFVRTPERQQRRRSTRKRWKGQVAR